MNEVEYDNCRTTSRVIAYGLTFKLSSNVHICGDLTSGTCAAVFLLSIHVARNLAQKELDRLSKNEKITLSLSSVDFVLPGLVGSSITWEGVVDGQDRIIALRKFG